MPLAAAINQPLRENVAASGLVPQLRTLSVSVGDLFSCLPSRANSLRGECSESRTFPCIYSRPSSKEMFGSTLFFAWRSDEHGGAGHEVIRGSCLGSVAVSLAACDLRLA